jgi:hypothetical protein
MLGLGPREMKQGDSIFLLQGLSVPVILRKRQDGAYSWIGDAYVRGIVDMHQGILNSGQGRSAAKFKLQ